METASDRVFHEFARLWRTWGKTPLYSGYRLLTHNRERSSHAAYSVSPIPQLVGAVIRCDPLDGQWQTLGAGRYRGIVAEGIEATANDWGPDQMTFAVKAVKPAALRPDLLPYTPIELEIDGMLVWAGRIKQRPSTEQEHSVTCEGWQYHLDDDAFKRFYVHTRVADYRDQRSFLTADLSLYTVGGQVNADSGTVQIGWTAGVSIPADGRIGVTLDVTPDTAKRLVMDWTSSNNDAGITCYARGHDLESEAGSTGGQVSDYFNFLMNTGASGTSSGNAATARRYVTIFLFNNTAAKKTLAADVWLKIKAANLFRLSTYDSGGSVLRSDTVTADALTFAPLLNQDTSRITAGSFLIPEYLTSDYQPPRDVIESVNAFENYQLYIGGSDLKTLCARPKVSVPQFVIGEWSGSEFADASVAGEDIYDKVIVTGTGPDGAPLVSTRTQTGTLVDRNGFHRTKVLPIRTAGTSAVYDRFGDLWLLDHKLSPFAGKLAASNGIRRWLGGSTVPAHELLIKGGERIHLSHRIDPDTGAYGRDGVIAGVRYRHDGRSLEIDIDDRRDHFESILNRYSVLVDQFLH